MQSLIDILQVLQDSNVLKSLLKPSISDSKIYPLIAKPDCNCITYKWYEVTNDKIKAQCKLEVRCFSKDILTAYNILEEVKQLIVTFADNELNKNILSVTLNGGITPMEDIDTHSYYVGGFFDLIIKL